MRSKFRNQISAPDNSINIYIFKLSIATNNQMSKKGRKTKEFGRGEKKVMPIKIEANLKK